MPRGSGTTRTRQKFAPKSWLTASVYNWGPYYLKRVEAAMNGTWKTGFYYGSIKDGFTGLAPYGPGVSAKTKALIAKNKAMIDLGQVLRVHRAAVRPERQAARAQGREDAGAQGQHEQPVRHELARQGRDREPEGLAGWERSHLSAPRNTGEAPTTAPLRFRPWRCAGSRSAFPAWSQTTGSTSRLRPERCTRCSGRTVPARARSRTSSPASTARTRARSAFTASR